MFPPLPASRGDHLYVMQKASGRIKIGRSGNPEQRRRSLELSSGQRVKLIAVFEGRGVEERAIHSRLAAFPWIGEWFQSSIKATEAIAKPSGRS